MLSSFLWWPNMTAKISKICSVWHPIVPTLILFEKIWSFTVRLKWLPLCFHFKIKLSKINKQFLKDRKEFYKEKNLRVTYAFSKIYLALPIWGKYSITSFGSWDTQTTWKTEASRNSNTVNTGHLFIHGLLSFSEIILFFKKNQISFQYKIYTPVSGIVFPFLVGVSWLKWHTNCWASFQWLLSISWQVKGYLSAQIIDRQHDWRCTKKNCWDGVKKIRNPRNECQNLSVCTGQRQVCLSCNKTSFASLFLPLPSLFIYFILFLFMSHTQRLSGVTPGYVLRNRLLLD